MIYNFIASDPPGIYNVLTSETHPLSTHLPENSIFRINTGAPLPMDADAVIMVEDTHLVSTVENSSTPSLLGEEKQVETLAQVPAGDNVRSPGSDVKKGDLVMSHGNRISRGGGEVGVLTFVGRKEVGIFLPNFWNWIYSNNFFSSSQVKVYKKPVVAILSTGNEIVDLHSNGVGNSCNLDDGWGKIFDTNRPSLQASLEGLGYEVIDLGIVPDS